MNFLSSKNHFDSMFVILCVIAGATSHTISNTSKTSINRLNNHHRVSFMDFIMDANLMELLQSSSSNTINKDLIDSYSSEHLESSATFNNQQSQPHTVCAQLSKILSNNQMKFCMKHYDILETVLPQVLDITRKECLRVTVDLKWNCPTLNLLGRSDSLGWYQFYD